MSRARLCQLSDSHGTATNSVWLPKGEGGMSKGLRARRASGGVRAGSPALEGPGDGDV